MTNALRVKSKARGWKRKLGWTCLGLLVLLPILAAGGMWFASSQILAASFRGAIRDFSVCKPETARNWGEVATSAKRTSLFLTRCSCKRSVTNCQGG